MLARPIIMESGISGAYKYNIVYTSFVFCAKQMEQQALVRVNCWRRQSNSHSCSHFQFCLGIYFSAEFYETSAWKLCSQHRWSWWKWSACTREINPDQVNLTVPIRRIHEKLRMVHDASNIPSFCGNKDSLSSWPSIQYIRYSTYFGADTSMGFFINTPSAYRYSYLGKSSNSFVMNSWSPKYATNYQENVIRGLLTWSLTDNIWGAHTAREMLKHFGILLLSERGIITTVHLVDVQT